MIIEFKSQIVSPTEELLDVHLSWDPSKNDEESKAAIIATFLDMVRKLNIFEKALDADNG